MIKFISLLLFLNCYITFSQHLHRTVIDIEGNRYPTYVVGDQIWMAENLRVTRFSNGDSIEFINQSEVWESLETPGFWKFPDFDKNKEIGLVYNWYVISDTRNICPRGWHVPSDSEWTKMLNFLGGSNVAGVTLTKKNRFFSFFNKKTVINSNFGVYFCGYLGFDGSYCDLNTKSSWWSKTENVSNTAWNRMMSKDDNKVYRDDEIKQAGLSVRCIKN
jgi:uncharacterized protein (TIGR02145 family)